MSSSILKYQSAFPNKDDGTPYDGMTYRQWAAAHITAAFIARRAEGERQVCHCMRREAHRCTD